MNSKIESLEEYTSLILSTCSYEHHVFRGVSNAQHKLIQFVGRNPNYSERDEIELFEQFKRKAHSTVPNQPNNDWE
jgi:hypothetical protein